MASYEDTVLGKNPVLYLRLDKTGTDSDGDSWPDLSGNGLDGTQVYTGTSDVARGHASPIETDGSSRAFKAWTNATVDGLAGTSRLLVPTDPLVEIPGDFTIMEWLIPRANIPTAADFAMVQKQGQFGTMLTGLGGGPTRIGGFAFDSNFGTTPLWRVVDTSIVVTDHLGTPFFVVVRRIGNVLQLLINAELKAQTSITSGLPTRISTSDFNIHPATAFHTHAEHDEPAIVAAALTDEDLIEIYDSALNNPAIVLRADLHLVATIDGTDEPEPQLFPFSCNWEKVVREDLSWLTDVIPAAQDYEQNTGIRQRPLRSFEYEYALLDDRQVRLKNAFLFQNQRRTVYARIETDTVQLSAAVSAGASSLSFPAENYDFDDGTKAALVDIDDETNYEIVELDTVGDTSSTLAAVTVNAWPKGTLVVPIRRALMKKEIDVRRHTDAMEDVSIVFDILAEDVALSPRRNATYTPRYTYKGFEVFDPFILGTNNFRDEGRGRVTVRAVDPESPAGISSRTAEDTASREIVSYSFFLDTRADIARFLGWLWSIQGRRVLLWVPTLQKNFIPVSTAGSNPPTLTIETHDYTDLYQHHQARRDLVLVYTDETMVTKRIDSAAASGANDVLTIEQVGALSLSNLLCASFLKLSRLHEDTIGLDWHTDQLLEVTLNFIDRLTTP